MRDINLPSLICWFAIISIRSLSMTQSESLTVAVIGAGPDRRKFGNKSVRAHLAAGYTVFPIHPTAEVVEGLPAYRSVKDIPVEKLDRVTVYLPPAIGLMILPQIAAVSPRAVWFNPGAESPELLTKARELGLNAIAGCSIVNLGLSPSDFPDV
jgi:predicted CoA-binding protein